MTGKLSWPGLLALMLMVALSAPSSRAACQMSNKVLRTMPPGEVEFIRADGSRLTLAVLIAANGFQRAQGFQNVCAERIAQTPILFDMQAEVVPSFHMRNVVSALDIAFIDAGGRIESIQHMPVYTNEADSKQRYRPNRRIRAALETTPGYFALHNIDVSTKLSWRQVSVVGPQDE